MVETPLGGAIVSVFIGLLLGLEREHSQRDDDERLFAGVRTFPLLVILGYVATLGGAHGFVWVLPVVVLGVAGLAVMSYLRGGARHTGATTETTAILAPLLGAVVAWNEALLAASLAVIVTLLLTLKARLHRIAGAITQDEIVAILKFGIVAVILAPLLPTTPIGPYGALVPRQIGIVVVALTAVSLIGYVLVRVVGGHAGWSLAGLLGGLASSTAVTLSFSGKARLLAHQIRPLAAGIVLASAVVYPRSFVVLSMFDRALAMKLMPAFAFLFLAGLVMGYAQIRRTNHDTHATEMRLGNPVELGQALALALLFMAILLAVRFAENTIGPRGLWMTGLLGGLIDVDSVVVATANIRRHDLVSLDTAAVICLLATSSNLVLKLSLVLGIGGKSLARRILWPFLVLMILTVLIIVLS
ncbi:MAG: MgtC/SapB family protein [Vicinamibacteria bacterium]|nr:MgtC/SapB family protein [Vicinamibacteria bacterium]